MIQLPIDEVTPGMVVARSVLGGASGVQLAAGFLLDEAVIQRCKRQHMRSIWVHLDGDETLPVGNVNDQLALQAQQAWKDNMGLLQKIGETHDYTLENLSKFTSDTGRFKNIVATEQLKTIVDQIIRSILGQEPLMVNLASMRTKDGYLHQHALDVTITATLIASRLKYSMQDIQELALGCFLMDLGMIIVPDSVFGKKGPLSLQENYLLEEHPAVGFAILRANEGININAAHVAYQHHERLDARGYPRQLKGEDVMPLKTLANAGGHIHRHAQIAAVADTYITAISPRPGTGDPMTSLEAIRQLIDEAGKGLNSHVVNALITLIPVFPVGTRVVVTKCAKPFLIGHIGIVTKANLQDKEKPEIVLVMDKFKRKTKPLHLNLAQEKGMEIQFASR
ncbi:MAG TPA: HD domain-containing phosphohydrolase [Fibrobacteria bacterium]|nr:HD domain-containing phosphohydrolase [Fibrobacteria bacterium]